MPFEQRVMAWNIRPLPGHNSSSATANKQHFANSVCKGPSFLSYFCHYITSTNNEFITSLFLQHAMLTNQKCLQLPDFIFHKLNLTFSLMLFLEIMPDTMFFQFRNTFRPYKAPTLPAITVKYSLLLSLKILPLSQAFCFFDVMLQLLQYYVTHYIHTLVIFIHTIQPNEGLRSLA